MKQIRHFRLPDGGQTPTAMSILICAEISEYVSRCFPEINSRFEQFIDGVPPEMAGHLGDELQDVLFGEERDASLLGGLGEVFYLPLLCLAYAHDALVADYAGRTGDAWMLIMESAYWLGLSKGGHVYNDVRKIVRTDEARARAKKMHAKPGGSNEKRLAIQAIWASGKYSSRDVCAEQEADALGMSFSTARKALRGTPDTN